MNRVVRSSAIVLVALLLALPLAPALPLDGGPTAAAGPTPHAHAPPTALPAAAAPAHAPEGVDLLPADLPDAELVLLLARHVGIDAARPAAPPTLPPGVTLPGMVHHLAHRAGAAHRLAPEDLLPFARLDPRVAQPVTLLLVALDRAWDLRDHAFRDVPDDDLRALAHALHEGRDAPELHAQVLARTDKAALVEAAILLLDTLEAHVLPALQDAIDAGAWPPQGAWDPAGVLRLGSMGDDLETIDRIVQIDPRGNDEYRNNAGGTTLLDDLSPTTLDSNVAVSVDFEGDDQYSSGKPFSLGAGFDGVGLFMEYGGFDSYSCRSYCLGVGAPGIGMARDDQGNDDYAGTDHCIGYGTGIGSFRDDVGDDHILATTLCGGVGGASGGTGLLWDRSGADSYDSRLDLPFLFGWGSNGGYGYLVDEGHESDYYATGDASRMPLPDLVHGCNDCTWQSGSKSSVTGGKTGYGNDNRGGLVVALANH